MSENIFIHIENAPQKTFIGLKNQTTPFDVLIDFAPGLNFEMIKVTTKDKTFYVKINDTLKENCSIHFT